MQSTGLWLICSNYKYGGYWWEGHLLWVYGFEFRSLVDFPPYFHTHRTVLRIYLANKEAGGTVWGWFLKRKVSSRFYSPGHPAQYRCDTWNPQNFSSKVSCSPKLRPVAGQGTSVFCVFPFSPYLRQLPNSHLLLLLLLLFWQAPLWDSRLSEHNSHYHFRIPLSSYYLALRGIVFQLHTPLAQLPVHLSLLSVIIFNAPETIHFFTVSQNKRERETERGRKRKEGEQEGREEGKKRGCEYIQLEKLKCWFLKFVLPCYFYFYRFYSTFCFRPGPRVKELLKSFISMNAGPSKSKIIPQIWI